MSNIDIVGEKFTSNKPYLFRALYEWIIDNDATPYMLVDATKENVQVPQHLVKDGQIVLNASPTAIRDWFADNSAVSFNTRFSGKAQNIYVPMNALLAIYAQENGMGMAFPEELEDASSDEENDSERQQELKNLSKPVAVEESEKSESKQQKPKKNSHLKVVK